MEPGVAAEPDSFGKNCLYELAAVATAALSSLIILIEKIIAPSPSAVVIE